MTSANALKKRLNDQVAAIIDTSETAQCEVIVRMGGPEAVDGAVLTGIRDGVLRRTLSTCARDLLPAKASALGQVDLAPTRPQRNELARADKSLSAWLAAQVIQPIALDLLKSTGLESLAPLVESDIVRSAIAAAAEAALARGTRSARPARPAEDPYVPIWASNTAILTLEKDALKDLPQAVSGIQEIHPNSRLFVPPMVTPQELPAAVTDNKACSWGLARTNALAAWGAYNARGQNILVGMLDTGVDATHPDIAGKIAHWAEFDSLGKMVPGSTPYDSDEHGTHCAGTICGGNHSGRWIGMAPEARLAAALVMNGKKGGTHGQILSGMQWAIERKVDVLSMSLGGLTLVPDVPDSYEIQIYNTLRVGIPVVVAIGNSGHQTTGSPGNDYLAFAVGATDHHDRIAGFSGGRTHIVRKSRILHDDMLPLVYSKPELSAPGVAVYSSTPNKGGKPQWKAANGTSMATPHVAGAIAQLLSATSLKDKVSPSIVRAQLIQDLLMGSVEELGEVGQDHRYGYGRLDVLRAIGAAHDLGYGP